MQAISNYIWWQETINNNNGEVLCNTYISRYECVIIMFYIYVCFCMFFSAMHNIYIHSAKLDYRYTELEIFHQSKEWALHEQLDLYLRYTFPLIETYIFI